MALSATAAHHRAKIAALSRSRTADDPELIAAHRDLRAERLADHVQKVLADAPPLTDAQRERIAALLRVGPRPQADHADLGLADTSPNQVGGDV
ncbi:hypothetical protein ACPXB3_05870 [Gordonia sp. DT219]|uniref:hypothetical protein n=1 Tax=Gordonia sp. DT219 TaxID=3416658 RepID=UPI003CF010EB